MEEDAPHGMIGAALAELRRLTRLDGAAVVDGSDQAKGPVLLHFTGVGVAGILDRIDSLLALVADAPTQEITAGGVGLLVCPWTLSPNRVGCLALWRSAGERTWDPEDTARAATAAAMMRVMLEYGPDESGIDRLTGLPNRLYFLEETDRHIERLAQDQSPGTLMVVEVDALDRFTLTHGQSARDWTLMRVGALIRAMVRPSDLVGRIGGGSFAAWLNGMDHMTAAERAEALRGRRLSLPEAPNRGVITIPTLSIGIASRTADSEEDARGLLVRAREAAALARIDGGGWRVSRANGSLGSPRA